MKPREPAKRSSSPPQFKEPAKAVETTATESEEELEQPLQPQPVASKETTSPGLMSYDEYRLMKHKEKQQKKMEKRQFKLRKDVDEQEAEPDF